MMNIPTKGRLYLNMEGRWCLGTTPRPDLAWKMVSNRRRRRRKRVPELWMPFVQSELVKTTQTSGSWAAQYCADGDHRDHVQILILSMSWTWNPSFCLHFEMIFWHLQNFSYSSFVLIPYLGLGHRLVHVPWSHRHRCVQCWWQQLHCHASNRKFVERKWKCWMSGKIWLFDSITEPSGWNNWSLQSLEDKKRRKILQIMVIIMVRDKKRRSSFDTYQRRGSNCWKCNKTWNRFVC